MTESDLVWMAFGIGLLSALSLPLGALTSFFWKPEGRVVAGLMAFGGGALLAESEAFRRAVQGWLRHPRIFHYLTEHQDMQACEASAWLGEANATLEAEGRLPDARPVERRADEFRAFAHQLDRMPWLEDLSAE